jgi:UDP-2,3-diacylglucosamine hydrolase
VKTFASALLVSDVHLLVADPATADLFLHYLLKHAPAQQALFILGDLFDVWPGDDLLQAEYPSSAQAQEFIACLGAIANRGTSVYLMHGNRDFLLDVPVTLASGQLAPSFSQAIHPTASVLPDPCVVSIAGKQILLTHGDYLCTDDVAYQHWRQTQARNPLWQEQVLKRPLAQRLALAQQIRAESEQTKRDKIGQIMDTNLEQIELAFQTHGVSAMVHGHTHRPMHHVHQHGQRWVLPDWHAASNSQMNRGGGLVIPNSGWEDSFHQAV